MTQRYEFDAVLWLYPGEAAWVFVTLPTDIADEIEESVTHAGGFGSVKVEVQVGGTGWSTSLFPSKEYGSYVLPVKRAVREAESLDIGGTVHVTLTPVEASLD